LGSRRVRAPRCRRRRGIRPLRISCRVSGLSQFAAVELSAIYHDVVKDVLYRRRQSSRRRRRSRVYKWSRVCVCFGPNPVFTADGRGILFGRKGGFRAICGMASVEILSPSAGEVKRWEVVAQAAQRSAAGGWRRRARPKQLAKALEAKLTLSCRMMSRELVAILRRCGELPSLTTGNIPTRHSLKSSCHGPDGKNVNAVALGNRRWRASRASHHSAVAVVAAVSENGAGPKARALFSSRR
jgi:hypothetical protein